MCAEHNVNIIEVSQSILQDMFCMIMLADMSACTIPFTAFADKAQALGEEMNLSVHAMHEDIFNSMHRIWRGTFHMINTQDILETINMIRAENLDIRTITMGISLLSCANSDIHTSCDKIYEKICRQAEHLVKTGENIEKEWRRR